MNPLWGKHHVIQKGKDKRGTGRGKKATDRPGYNDYKQILGELFPLNQNGLVFLFPLFCPITGTLTKSTGRKGQEWSKWKICARLPFLPEISPIILNYKCIIKWKI